MEFLQPATWPEALQMKAAHPQAVPIQGGTDVMVELNFDRYRPEYLLDLTRVDELAQWAPDDGRIRLGAGVSYTRVITELGDRLPGLAMASRTVGSPQIRNRGTVGGNLGAASPAGDSHPALLAAYAASVRVTRSQGLPLRVLPVLRWPALSWLPGHIPAQLAKWPAVGKRPMSVPISAGMTSADQRPPPGSESSRASAVSKGARRSATCSPRAAICSSRMSMWGSCWASRKRWWALIRPVSARSPHRSDVAP